MLTTNFKISEFRCHDGTHVPDRLLPNLLLLCESLELLRTKLGDVPIQIISGYRTPAYNKKCGGVPKSQHLKGKAADIRVKGWSPEDIADIAVDIFGGTGLYDSFVHVDVRKGHKFWDGR